jgi:hypothetical protein
VVAAFAGRVTESDAGLAGSVTDVLWNGVDVTGHERHTLTGELYPSIPGYVPSLTTVVR